MIAGKYEEGINAELSLLRIALCVPKSLNFVASPGLISGAPFRRVPNPHRKANLDRPMLDQQNDSMLEDLTLEELIDSKIFSPVLRQSLPFEWCEAIRIPGVVFDPLLTFRTHISKLMGRARIRHNSMSSLAKTNWGLETGILRATPCALLVSLTRYGLVLWAL